MNRRTFLRQSTLATITASLTASSIETFAADQEPLRREGAPKKIVIIGAGLAGMCAATELVQAGHDVTILEARLRPGGRVFTMREPFSDGLYAEAGAMFIPDTHDLTLKYAKLFDLSLDPFRQPGLSSISYIGGQRIKTSYAPDVAWPVDLTPEEKQMGLGGMWEKYRPESAIKDIGNAAATADWPLHALKKYDDVSFNDFLRAQGASPAGVKLLTLGLTNLWGEGLESVSALAVLRDMAHIFESRARYRIRGGNDLLPKAFAARLSDKIRYGSPVVKIEHDARAVRVTFMAAGTHHTIGGDRLICAVPFSTLRRIEVSPRFTPGKTRAIEQLPYFSAARVSLQSRKRFWKEAGMSGFADTDLPIADVFDMTANQDGQRGILQSYMGGATARRVAAMKEAERVSFVLEHMEKVYPGIRENFEGGASKCWDEDEWSRGASSWYRPGQMSELWPHVAAPEGRVHFAGDHTSAWIRWMQGALHSGLRVAREVNNANENI